jgi:hypothetical protein
MKPRTFYVAVCPSTDRVPNPIPKSTRDLCIECRQPIWVAPSTAQAIPEVAYRVCLGCAGEIFDGLEINVQAPTPEQLEEARAAGFVG